MLVNLSNNEELLGCLLSFRAPAMMPGKTEHFLTPQSGLPVHEPVRLQKDLFQGNELAGSFILFDQKRNHVI